ncbi:MAG: ABC transporter ATP-binding protein/permease, partial [Psychrosphaera sp.]|nr:ABC transporter ATP-binding protein/permease [Psychrosphaera sp.]
VAFSFLASVGLAWVYFFGGSMLINGQLTIGTLIAFTVFTQRLYQPIAFLSHTVLDISSGVVSLRRLFEFLDMEKESKTETENTLPIGPVCNDDYIKFDNVSFYYDSQSSTPTIDAMSFSIKKGEKVAFVGGNGAGKSTIALLLAGMFPAGKGQISIGDLSINHASAEQIAAHVGTAIANSFFFNATIAENIKIVNSQASLEDVNQALENAYCMPFINSLPNGVNTHIGQDGYQLSSGQKQRLSIARLFLKNTPIYVLDEITSNLDVESESYILKSIDRISQDNTTIIISHSIKTIEKADRIFVIEDGRLVSQGTVEKLSRECESFRKTFKLNEVIDTSSVE